MLNKKLKRVVSCVVLSFCMMSTTAFAGTWEGSQYHWKYLKDDGSYANSQWIYDNGSWYFFNKSGVMAYNEDLDNDGARYLGFNYDFGGYSYYVDWSGKMVSGGFVDKDSTDKLFADKDGHLVKGLFMVDGDLYYASSSFNVDVTYAEPAYLLNYNNGKDAIEINCYHNKGKILDRDGKPFEANSKLYTIAKYVPKYDSKGNFIGEIKNSNGYDFQMVLAGGGERGPM